MLLNEEEEKKKREEDIKRLFGTKDSEESVNETPKVEISDTYNKRIQDVKNLFGIDDEIEEPITQDETEDAKVTPQMLVTNTTPSTDYELESIRNKDNNKAKVDEKQLKNVQANANLVNPQNNNDGNMAISNFRAGQNLNPIVDKTNVDNKEKNETTTIKATQNANIASKDDVKNVKKASNSDIYLLTNGQVDYRSQTEKSIDSFAGTVGNIGEGVKDFVPSIVDYLATGTENGSKITIKKGLKLLGYSDEDIEKITNVAMENYKKMSPLSVLNNLLNNDYKNNLRNERIQRNILKASSNSFTKKLAEVAPSIGSNLASSTLTAVNPVLGMMSFIFSAGGSYLDDAEARGMNDEEAFTYASIMGVLEGGTEYIITGKAFSTLLKAFSGKGLSKEVLNSYGVSTAENFLQEFVMEPFQEATAMVTGGADKADWDNIWGRALEAGCDGVLSSIILGGASAGIGSAQKVINKANPTVNEYAQALTDSINSGKVDVKGIVNGAKQAIIDNGGTQQFYTTTFNQDGNIENVQAVKGKAINNPNSNVNVAPVIIKNENNSYNVIDKNTGILLDSTPYTTLIEAQSQFNDKINNLDSASINNINNQIAKATIAIENELNKNVQEQNAQASNENVTNNNQNVTNTSQSGTENVQNDIQTGANNVNVSETFRKDLEKYKTGKYNQKDAITVLDTLPDYFYNLGYEIDKPLMLNMNKLETIMKEPKGNFDGRNQHGITMDIIEQIPYAISNPLNVIKNPDYRNRFVIVTDLTDQYGDIILVPVEINNNAEITGINKITSIYGKETYDTPAKDNLKSYMEQNRDNIVYDIDNKNSISSNYRLQLPSKTRNTSTNSISQSDINMQAISKKTTTSKTGNNNPSTYQASQNQLTDDYNSETTNYTSSNANVPTSQNNVLQDIQETVSKISDNTIYKTEEASKVFRTIARNIPTIELQVNENGASLNSLNENGEVVYSQKLSGRPYRGAKIKQIVNNAISNADTSNINTAQTNKNGFRDVSNNETSNYMSNDGNVRNNVSNLSDEEIKNIVKYNPDGRVISDENYVNFLVDRYKDNKNISGVVTDTSSIREILSKNNSRIETLKELYNSIENTHNITLQAKLKNEKGNLETVNLDIDITLSGLKESFNKGESIEKYSIVPYLDKIIYTVQDGDGYFVMHDDKNRVDVKGYYYLFNTAEIDNKLYSVKIDIKKTKAGDRFYVHRVKLINNEGASIQANNSLELEVPVGQEAPSVNTSISQQNKNVKNDTNVTNKSMQNNKNNTTRSEKNIVDINKEIKYNSKGLKLSKKEYANVMSLINTNKTNEIGMNYISSANYFYIYKNNGFGNNTILARIEIDGNEKLLKKMREEFKNGRINREREIIDKLIQEYPDARGRSNGNNVMYSGQREESKQNDRLHINRKEINEKIRGRQDSNKSTRNKSGIDSGVRAERTSSTSNNKIEYDSKGNKLSKSQQEFFKDSKVRDEKGNLLVMYHGTEANVGIPEEFWFTVFDIDKSGNHGNMLGDGFYFTSNKEHAQQYSHSKGNIYETYLNITKPLELEHFSTGDLAYSIRKVNPFIEADIYKRDGTIDGYKVRKYLLDNGYDGIHSGDTFVAFNSNQIKNITNKKPTTSNPDIRYENTDKSNTTNQQYNSRNYEENEDFMKYLNENEYLRNLMEVDENQGETYAHSAERLVEQEIRKLEQTNGFDNSIPVTKLTDIDREIENYLGKTIGKGHFRERARGIYNKNIDRIRVKEYKDLDNVFHELGHALDLGRRITVDKASLSDELLAAVRRHGGYENESIGVQLDEGFAEILKTYAINKDIVRQDYPKSYKVLEDFKASNVEFGKFITKLQEDTYNYIHQSPRNRGLSNQSIGEQTDKETITIEKIAHKAVKTVYDSNYEVKRMQEEFSKATGHKPTPSQNAYLLTRLASGVDNKIVSMLTNGYVDENGNRLMPGLGRIGEILGNDAERINDLRAYLAAKRDLEYKAKTLKTGLRTMDSKKIVEQFYNDAQIQEAAQVVYDTLDGVLQYAVDNGLITEENAKSLRESNVFYVPFQRVIEGRGNQVGRRGAVSDIIKQRTGSELDIKDVLENIVTNSANIIKQVENNNILRAVYEQGEETGMKNNVFDVIPAPMRKIGTEQLSTWEAELKRQGIDTSELDLDKTIDLFAPNNNIITEKDGSHIVSFFDKNGKRKYLQFYKGSTDIFNSLMGLDKNANSTFLKIMRSANMPLRYGATMANVGFAIPNMISDTVQASIFSEAGFIPVVDNVLGVLDVLGATNKTVRNFLNQVAPEYAQRINNLYDIYQQTGATSSMRMAQYRKSAQEIMRDIYGTKNSESLGIKESFKPLKRLMDILTYIPELSESSTRFRVFERNYDAYINKGMSETDARIQAAIESRDATQDFGRTGTLMREVNQLIPFSAARVGSAYTFAERAKANPRRTVARVAILLAVTMAIKAIGYDDDEIEELNQRKKDDNFVLKIGDTVITIKKPQGILRSIVNLTEYIQDLFTGHIEEGKEGERLVEWATNAIMDNMPADSVTGLVPNAIAPVVENAINKDFYYNTDIVKSYDLDLPEAQQYYDYTSQFAIWLGQIFNYSPAKIDNLISGYLGGVGTQLTDIIDWVSGKLGFSVEEPDMGAEDNAVGKRFVVNVNENSASVDEIYERKDELTKKLNGGTITEKENAELEDIKSGISKISALNKQIKAIKQDLSMSGSAKADAIKPLQEQKVDVARQALGKNTIYTNNTDELESLEFYPSRSELSLNGLTLELTEEMKTEYMNMAYELYQKYSNQGLYNEEYLEKIKTKVKDAAKKKMMQKYRSQLVK